jgi:nickel/cobalt transporter (NicO) family protein
MSSMQGLAQILWGSLALSLIHAVIPNHWIPLVAVGKAENWSRRELGWATAMTGAAHTVSTILIGLVIGFFGYQLASNYEFITQIVAPLILISLGLIYLIADAKGNLIGHRHDHIHDRENYHNHTDDYSPIKPPGTAIKEAVTERSKLAILAPLGTAMFFSPCIEIEAYYFAAGSLLGWLGILMVSGIYFIITILGMMLLVEFGR